MHTRWHITIPLIVLICGALSSCAGGQAGAGPEPTITPLNNASAPAQTPAMQAQDAQTDISAAQQAISQEKFTEAVKLLRHAASVDSGAPVQPLLAETYLGWGRSLLAASAAGPLSVDMARERFVDGLAMSIDDGQTSQDLKAEIELAERYTALAQAIAQLKQQIADKQGAAAQASAAALLIQLDQVKQQMGSYPPLPELIYDGYLTVGDTLQAGGDLQEAQNAYQHALGSGKKDTSLAVARLASVQQAQATPTAPPTPRATAKPATPKPALVEVPDVRGSDPGQAETFLKNRGFSVTLTQITDEAQVRGLCKQQVSYTSPKGGAKVAKGTLVRVFYRGFDSFRSPPECPTGR